MANLFYLLSCSVEWAHLLSSHSSIECIDSVESSLDCYCWKHESCEVIRGAIADQNSQPQKYFMPCPDLKPFVVLCTWHAFLCYQVKRSHSLSSLCASERAKMGLPVSMLCFYYSCLWFSWLENTPVRVWLLGSYQQQCGVWQKRKFSFLANYLK